MSNPASVSFIFNLINSCSVFDPGAQLVVVVDGQPTIPFRTEYIGEGALFIVIESATTLNIIGSGYNQAIGPKFTLDLVSPDMGLTWEVVNLTTTNVASGVKCSCRECQFWVGNASFQKGEDRSYSFNFNVGCINDLLCCGFKPKCPPK